MKYKLKKINIKTFIDNKDIEDYLINIKSKKDTKEIKKVFVFKEIDTLKSKGKLLNIFYHLDNLDENMFILCDIKKTKISIVEKKFIKECKF